jgi:putative CocE/NonD family hydrolase
VQLVRNLVIPLSDGVTLAADLHLPGSPGRHPTLVSFYPYRKDDIIGSFSVYARHWFAARGYAHLLVDVRGYGGSEGRRAESFHPLPESADAAEVVEWAAAQEWSDGSVGVWGISYGGLMALAAGAARPPHLRAIAPVYPLFDVAADVLLLGGCPAMLGQHQWSTMMLAQGLAPPTYRDADGRWLRVWQERLARIEHDGPEASFWQAHPDASADYWRERILPIEQIAVPTFLVGGWRDLFPETVARAFALIQAPKRLLIGPWLHVQPDLAAREPVDWLPMLLGFWEEHLRGGSSASEPPIQVFVHGAGWRAATSWPPAGSEERVLHPGGDGQLGSKPGAGAAEYESTPLVGTTEGQWDTLGTGMGYPLDQGPDDARSLTFTTAPLAQPLELAGSPVAELELERLDQEGPFSVVAKLVDVSPDGRAELVTTGWARSRGGATAIVLWATAWRFAPGHRLRLSVSCADFPRVWPDPAQVRIQLDLARSSVRLPTAPAGVGEPTEPPRPSPVAPSERSPWTIDGGPIWTIEHDLAGDGVAVTLGGGETMRLPEGGRLALRQRATARVQAGHADAASVQGEVTIEIASPGGEHIVVESRSRTWRERNLYNARVTIDGRTVLERCWRNF